MTPLLEVADVSRIYRRGGVLTGTVFHAVDAVSFALPEGRPEVFTIIGESGSGKTTLSRMILGMVTPSSGTIRFRGTDVAAIRTRRARLTFMRHVQPIFQNPFEAFNPLKTIDRYLFATEKSFPLEGSPEARIDRALQQVGLSLQEVRGRFPHELSGGQLQRVAIARALIPGPALLVADEPVSMVDASLRMAIVNVFRALRDGMGVSIIYITHDLATAYTISDRLIIMRHGRVVESGPARSVLDHPRDAYSIELKNAVLQAPDTQKEMTRMRNVAVVLRPEAQIGTTDPRLFGAFVEHVGRCVYGGIYEPGHPTADAMGFRGDVLALVRELGPTIMRYPGGNFVSGYNWEDGVGPVAQRPRRLDLAWMSTEPNAFGTNEFIAWCRAANIEPMLAVNLGTRAGDAARNLVEYCNHGSGTALSDLRAAHGYREPHKVRFWCLGNEMDGPWQMEMKTAEEYGRVAVEAAKMMQLIDPSITLAACGSSGRTMPTYGAWEHTVLEHCFERVDFISLHTYLNDYAGDTEAFLASPDLMDGFIEEVVAIADAVAARRRSSKRVMLSFDEWNVWYRTRRNRAERVLPGWPVAPPILEEIYTMKDALAFGGACISLLNHADRVRCACLAQLVNAIAPIMTETGGPAWRQTIFHPFAQMSRHGRGRVLRAEIDGPSYSARYFDPRGADDHWYPVTAPYLKLAAVHADDGALTLFALNRHLEEPMPLDVRLPGFGALRLADAQQLADDDLNAANTKSHPDRVQPSRLQGVEVQGDRLRATLAPTSWTMLCLRPV